MKRLLCGLVAACCLSAIQCASAQQAPQNQTDQGIPPGAAGVSKPGIAGKPGEKSGTTVTPSGREQENGQQQAQTKKQDESGVQAKPDTEAGRVQTPPTPQQPQH